MAHSRIEELTVGQKALMPDYRDKWRAIALSTERINRQKATDAVKAAYALCGKKAPEIVFFDSPAAALRKPKNLLQSLQGSLLRGKMEKQLGVQPGREMGNLLEDQLGSEVITQLKQRLWGQLTSQLGFQLSVPLWIQLKNQLGSQNDNCIQPELWACYVASFDFCISVLNCAHDPTKWEALQAVVLNCGWIFPWEKTCFVCDRPNKLSFDRQQRLHAEGEPAIQFADSFSVYAYRGVTLSEKHGKLPPSQWQPQWILQERDPEVRRVLIEGIGMLRIRQELGNIELDL